MFVMASACTHKHTCAQTTHVPLYRADRLLAGEAEERYITRLDKPVQRNILEIRSAIIYYRGSFLRGAPAVPLRRIRRSISARIARPASRWREKTQLRGQTAEVGVGKTVKNARPDGVLGKRASNDAKAPASRIEANSDSRISARCTIYSQHIHIHPHTHLRVYKKISRMQKKASKSAIATASSRPVIRKHNSFAVV